VLSRQAPEDARELTKGVVALCDVIEGLGIEGPVLDRGGGRDDVPDLLDVLAFAVVQPLLR
jgi:hypothetical protein